MLLELSDVGSFYGRTQILWNMSFGVAEGHCVAVLGRNGVGKTTLMRTIMGLTSRATGSLKIKGYEAVHSETHERALAGIGYVPQGRGVLPNFTVRENLLLGTFAREDRRRTIPELCLELFPYLANNLEKRAGQLSGGQQQQLAIARALASDPLLLLLDEPTEGIQPNIVAEIGQTLERLNRELGVTVVLTEQHVAVARELSTHFLLMDNGRIAEQGGTDSLTDELVQKYLML